MKKCNVKSDSEQNPQRMPKKAVMPVHSGGKIRQGQVAKPKKP